MASPAELEHALRLGFVPHRIVLDSPAKTRRDLRRALAAGGRLNADNPLTLTFILSLSLSLSLSLTLTLTLILTPTLTPTLTLTLPLTPTPTRCASTPTT